MMIDWFGLTWWETKDRVKPAASNGRCWRKTNANTLVHIKIPSANTHTYTRTLPQGADIFSNAIRSTWLATVMRRGRWRLVPFTGQRADKAQCPGLELWSCLLAGVCQGCVCLYMGVICIPLHRAMVLFCLIWARCSLPAITWHCRVHSQCVFFISTPRGICNCSVLMRTAPAQSTISYRNYTHRSEGEKNSENKESTRCSRWKTTAFPPPADPSRGW